MLFDLFSHTPHLAIKGRLGFLIDFDAASLGKLLLKAFQRFGLAAISPSFSHTISKIVRGEIARHSIVKATDDRRPDDCGGAF